MVCCIVLLPTVTWPGVVLSEMFPVPNSVVVMIMKGEGEDGGSRRR